MPYYWAGIKAYDFVAGKQLVKKSYFLRKSKALEEFPMLQGSRLCGTIVYYDGEGVCVCVCCDGLGMDEGCVRMCM